MLTVKSPVSLVLAGEWASHEDGNSCLASAINKNVVVTIEVSESVTVDTPLLGTQPCAIYAKDVAITLKTVSQQKLFDLIKRVITTTCSYLKSLDLQPAHFALTINTDNVSITQKNGEIHCVDLNINAAIGVAIVKAIFQFYEQSSISASAKQQIFKIVFLACYDIDNNQGYGPDIAASTYATTVLYQHVSFAWISKQLSTHKDDVFTIIEKAWPDLKLVSFSMPDDLRLCVCFIEDQRSAHDFSQKIASYKSAYPVRYRQLCASINIIVKDLAQAIQDDNKEAILILIKQNKQLLKHLFEESGNEIKAPALEILITCAEDCGAAAKFVCTSETGYGFALCLNRFTAQKVKRKWEKKGMQMLNTQILG